MGSSTSTAKRRLADTLIEGGLSDYVSARRSSGQSWRVISLAIREDIDIDIHPDTLRLWYVERTAVKAS
jgi:intein-encoded DNA endonuclease-like protein